MAGLGLKDGSMRRQGWLGRCVGAQRYVRWNIRFGRTGWAGEGPALGFLARPEWSSLEPAGLRKRHLTYRFPGERLGIGSPQVGERAGMDDRPGLPRIAWIATRCEARPGVRDALLSRHGWQDKS